MCDGTGLFCNLLHRSHQGGASDQSSDKSAYLGVQTGAIDLNMAESHPQASKLPRHRVEQKRSPGNNAQIKLEIMGKTTSRKLLDIRWHVWEWVVEIAKVGNLNEQVPTFNLNWCAGRDSNS